MIIGAGCGNGYLSKEFSLRLNNNGKIYALDSDNYEIGILKEETKGTLIVPLEADITQPVPLKTSSIDLIYLATVFHIFTKARIAGFQREVTSLLKPGGILAIVEIEK